MFAARTSRVIKARSLATSIRHASTHSKILVVGGGTAGTTVASQLKRAFYQEGRALGDKDITIVEPAKTHHCEFSLSLTSEQGGGKKSGVIDFEQNERLTLIHRIVTATDQPGWTLV